MAKRRPRNPKPAGTTTDNPEDLDVVAARLEASIILIAHAGMEAFADNPVVRREFESLLTNLQRK